MHRPLLGHACLQQPAKHYNLYTAVSVHQCSKVAVDVKACRPHADRTQSRLDPTELARAGTPIQNNMAELYGIMSLLDPDEFGEEAEFLARYGGSRDQPMPSAEQVVALQARAPARRRAQRPLRRRNTRRLAHSTSTNLRCSCSQVALVVKRHVISMDDMAGHAHLSAPNDLRRPTTMRVVSSPYQHHCIAAHASCVHSHCPSTAATTYNDAAQEALRPRFLRRMKEDVEALPEKEEVVVWVELTAQQRVFYKGIYSGQARARRACPPPRVPHDQAGPRSALEAKRFAPRMGCIPL